MAALGSRGKCLGCYRCRRERSRARETISEGNEEKDQPCGWDRCGNCEGFSAACNRMLLFGSHCAPKELLTISEGRGGEGLNITIFCPTNRVRPFCFEREYGSQRSGEDSDENADDESYCSLVYPPMLDLQSDRSNFDW